MKMPPPIESISSRLLQHADIRSATLATTRLAADGTPSESLDYGTLEIRTRALASHLLQRGAREQPVLIPERNGVDYVVAYLACLRAGAIAVTAYPPRSNDRSGRLEAIVQDAQPLCALASSKTIQTCTSLDEPLLPANQFVATDAPDLETDAPPELPDVDPESIAMYQYTSGSTSAPRAVCITHANLMANLDVMSTLFYRSGSISTVCWLPLFHDMGMIGLVMTSLVNGITAHLMAPEEFVMRPIRWLQAISRNQAAHSGGPNFAFELCVTRTTPKERAELDLRCWKSAMNGAEVIRPGTIHRFLEAFEPCGFSSDAMQPCYGLAESTLVVATRRLGTPLAEHFVSSSQLAQNRVTRCDQNDPDARAVITCGPPVDNHEICIVDRENESQELVEGEVGEICVRGPSVALGYRNTTEDSSDTFVSTVAGRPGPWLRTGDLGSLLDGELIIAGRMKDLIIVGGSNHHPQDLERTAENAHPDIARGGCAAFAVETDSGPSGEQVVLLLEPTRECHRSIRNDHDARQAIHAAMNDAVSGAISSSHAVTVTVCMLVAPGSIPRTTSGKIRRTTCALAWSRGEIDTLGEA